MTPEQASRYTILKAIVGSRALGLETPTSDTDEMGILIEPIEEAYGLDQPFEQFVRTGPDDRREGNDIQIYGLRKFLRLALSGNPTILALLYIPYDKLLVNRAPAGQLRELVPKIVSRVAGKAFLGYMQAQLQRLKGERGQKGVNRPELVAKFGYDTKYAMHVLRLGIQGLELLTTGTMTFPMVEPDLGFLRDVRDGGMSYKFVLSKAAQLEAELKYEMDFGRSPLPPAPDRPAVQTWMVQTYLNTWKAQQLLWRLSDDSKSLIDVPTDIPGYLS